MSVILLSGRVSKLQNGDRKIRLRFLLLLLGRIILAAIFLVSGYEKMRPVANTPWSLNSLRISAIFFAFQVDAYELLPHSGAILVAKVLPPFEMFLGLWLLSGIGIRFSSICATLLLMVFVFVVTWAYVHGLKIDCGCGSHEQVGPRKIVEDLLMLGLALAVTFGVAKSARRHALAVTHDPAG